MAFSTDKKLWRYGSKVAGNIGHGVAWELDFLRGMVRPRFRRRLGALF